MEKSLKRKEPSPNNDDESKVAKKAKTTKDIVFVVGKLEEVDDYKRRTGPSSRILGVFREESDAKHLITTTKREFVIDRMQCYLKRNFSEREDLVKMLDWDDNEIRGIKDEFQENEDAIEELFDFFNEGEFVPYKMEIFFTKHIVH